MTRLQDWNRRVHFPSTANAPLGGAYEYWNLDPTRYEGHAELKTRAAGLGLKWTKRRLAYQFVMHLIDDVIAAAGGVEHSITAMRSAITESQEWIDKYSAPNKPPVARGIAHDGITRAWFEFANVLSWARAIEERLDRRALSTKGNAALPRQGLVNAVKPARLKKRLEYLVTDLRAGPLAETRLLANFILHAALVRNPYSGADLTTSGRISMPIPDKSTSQISHIDLLSWNDNRNATEFAEQLWASIEKFIDSMLDAFEKATPKRLKL